MHVPSTVSPESAGRLTQSARPLVTAPGPGPPEGNAAGAARLVTVSDRSAYHLERSRGRGRNGRIEHCRCLSFSSSVNSSGPGLTCLRLDEAHAERPSLTNQPGERSSADHQKSSRRWRPIRPDRVPNLALPTKDVPACRASPYRETGKPGWLTVAGKIVDHPSPSALAT
jgi:hypothetical protein